MSESGSNVSSGGGFFSILAVLFIALKLLGVTVVATWSWWWVLSPLWIPITIFVIILIIVYLIAHL